MAQVPYSEGVTDVQPRVEMPDDYQHIQTDPNMFGGAIAKGAGDIGGGLSKAGQFFGQVAADDGTNQYMEGIHKILYGTGQVNPDTGQADTGYYGLRGKAALDARPDVEAKLSELQKTLRGNMQTADQQLLFDQNTRRFQYLTTNEMGRFADQQTDAYATDVNKTGYQNQLTAVAGRPEDDVFAMHALQTALQYRTRLAQITGEDKDPEKLAQIRTQTASDITEARIKALIPTNAPKAMAMLNENRTLLQGSTNYDQLSSAVQNKYIDQQGTAIGQRAISAAGNGLVNPPAQADSITSAIFGQESGNKDTVRPSANGAIGPGQIMPATFAQYAKPGEDINNPADNRAVGQRIVSDLESRFPNDPARVAVGYFSGPGNVSAPGSVTPWVNNTKDANGKTVSSYVSDITQRLAASSPHIALRATAYDNIMNSTDDPKVQRVAMAYVREQYDAAQVASLADQKARQDASDRAANGYVSRMLTGDNAGIVNQIAADPSLSWETKMRLGDAAVSHSQNDVEKATREYGGGFWPAYKTITAPQPNEQRITSVDQLLTRAGPGGDLSLAGIDKLASIMQGKKTPEGEAETKMQAQTFNVVHRQLSGEDALPGQKDPQGERIFAHALPMLYRAIQQGKDKGIPASELYDPQNPNWVGNSVKGLQRSPDQYYSDLVGNTATTAKGPDLSSKDGVVAAYQSGHLTRGEAAAALTKLGINFQQPQPVDPGPPVPLP